ncbi:hypothetical protein PMAYCL1PPCAC_11207 [Pristionchus mayeri]|uniref:DUF7027 domain-containing protein n=1 Tax=Pristionchus mayeri TaxID=1317129 RepID=A0AAN5CES1_9BILA|nr:hypothetical protein PMAYCL1PPCAC_11207 [Pristionchus mayeri]
MRCCWDTFDIETGARIIAGLMLTGACLTVLSVIGNASNPNMTGGAIAITICWSFVQGTVSSLVFVAVKQHNAQLMVPMLVFNIAAIVVLAIFDIIILIFALNTKGIDAGGVVIILLVPAIAAGLQAWFFTVFRKCYKYLKEMESGGEYGTV